MDEHIKNLNVKLEDLKVSVKNLQTYQNEFSANFEQKYENLRSSIPSSPTKQQVNVGPDGKNLQLVDKKAEIWRTLGRGIQDVIQSQIDYRQNRYINDVEKTVQRNNLIKDFVAYVDAKFISENKNPPKYYESGLSKLKQDYSQKDYYSPVSNETKAP